ncbi:hypothetical protein [Streptomyces sp. NPDC002104]
MNLASLRGLPQKPVTVECASAKGQQKRTYRGVLLHDVLKDAQPRFDASKKNGRLRRRIVAATGGGDHRARTVPRTPGCCGRVTPAANSRRRPGRSGTSEGPAPIGAGPSDAARG